MKTFILQVLIFCSIFFIVDKFFYVFIEHAAEKEDDRRLESVYNGEMNKELIILGSSRGANNIIAKQLEQETGLSTYNLSYRGSNIEFQEFVLFTLLKFNKAPKKLVLVIDSNHEFKKISLVFRDDRLLPLKKYNYFNNKLIEIGKKNVLSRILCLARVDRQDFKLKPIKVAPINILTSHGSKIIKKKYNIELIYDESQSVYDSKDENSEYLKAFKNIQAMCDENQIELFYAFPPNFSAFNISFYKRFKNSVNTNHKVLVYDTLQVNYKNEAIFRDPSHLMEAGARQFTTELSTFINSKN